MLPSTGRPALTIRLFGPFEGFLEGAPLPRLRSRTEERLLALLVLRHGAEVERAWLAGTLWPETEASVALANLRRSLHHLRGALGDQASRLQAPTPRTLCIDLAGAEADVVTFDAAVARGDPASLEEAVALYRGPLLEGETEEWIFQERQAREQAYLQALETLASQASQRGDPAAAERALRRAVAVDPLRESAQRALMQALAAGGNYAAAIHTYRELRELLHREVNAEPGPETRALFERLRAEARSRADTGSKFKVLGSRFKVQGSKSPDDPTLNFEPSNLEPAGRPRPRPLGGEDTVTFLFTDVEGSTRLWEEQPDVMRLALARHDTFLRDAIETNNGRLFKTMGDAFCAAFVTATDAVDAALAAQRHLCQAQASALRDVSGLALRVRMALHTGTAEERDGDYLGPALNRLSRLLSAAHGGQVLLSGATQALVQDDLPPGASLRDLGTHRLRDLQRPEPVFQLLHPDLPADFPPLATLDLLPNNLPQQVTSFIGREREMEEVRRLLRMTRLLTITGAGGTGKTRLALQVAAELLDGSEDGVWLVELASLAGPALVPQAVAAALGVPERADAPLVPTLVKALKPRKLLLVLDNCEHLLEACAALAEALLRGCPTVAILATSREALNIRGETTYRLPSLGVPDAREWLMVDGSWFMKDRASAAHEPSAINHQPSTINHQPSALLQYEAVRLFVDRATAAVPSFALTPENAAAVAQVCCRLDGIPLAIELAAARVKALPVERIAERLDDCFRLLTGGSRTALPRQQTLRALIDWSYDLLTGPEQALLRRLAVFAGGWTLEAAEAVCAGGAGVGGWGLGVGITDVASRGLGTGGELSPTPNPQPPTPDDVLDLLTLLVEKSLVLYEEREGEARYRLLETVRQYARERLSEAGEEAALRGRHRDWYVVLAERVEPRLWGAEQIAWLDRLEAERGNLRAALEWSRGEGQAAGGSRQAAVGRRQAAGGRGQEAGGSRQEAGKTGSELPTAACLLPPGPSPAACRLPPADYPLPAGTEAELRLFGALRVFWGVRGRGQETRERVTELLARVGADVRTPARAKTLLLAVHLADQREYSRARAMAEESVALFRELGDRRGIAEGLSLLARMAFNDEQYDCAGALWEESLALARETGDRARLVTALNGMGRVAFRTGHYDRAAALLEECLAASRELGDKRLIAWALHSLGRLAAYQGEYERAIRWHEEAQSLFEEVGEKMAVAGTLLQLGQVAVRQDEDERAIAWVEAAQALYREMGYDPASMGREIRAEVARRRGDPGPALALYCESLAQMRDGRPRWGMAGFLEGLARVSAAQGEPERAARLLGAAEAVREATGSARPPAERPDHQRQREALRGALGEEALRALLEEGHAMKQEQAIAYALRECTA